ncbi:class I SAM-dependent methyltransferase [uncultured Tenacibaculum sp.]|uniref:class I SAM-dependent DNA methyltransferase n=1 Tax=uncultured Tenacibaculum sp. TaxID=174713 RepID=UPI0026026F9C|nr:class I SAM-dependent methyltransferase [uncultured Tenacibaculum sp.]
MQSLYSNGFENIYDEMYQTFINYEEEFQFYSEIIKKYHKENVLEIGCGSGHLAKHFIHSSIGYNGMDLSNDMVLLSQKRNPTGTFLKGDMTNFYLNKTFKSILITARTTSYLLNNVSVQKAIKNIYNHLDKKGIFCFDFIDANRFFKLIKDGKTITHNAETKNKKYSRTSFMKPKITKENFMFQWDAKYYEIKDQSHILLTDDQSEVRAFTINEWQLFLELNNFEILEIIDRKSYAFDTYVIVAQKQ